LAHELPKNYPLRFAYDELFFAEQAYQQMIKIRVSNFPEYEKAWRQFLHHIERVWVKSKAAVKDMPNWQKIEAEVSTLRKKDPLLSYIHQARNVDEHSISELTRDWDPKIKSKQKGAELEISWEPYDYKLLPVKNRGVIYDTPKTHLGQSIVHLKGKGKLEPRIIAELALRFYVDFFNRVSRDVVGENY
jgi:hypothetical protein